MLLFEWFGKVIALKITSKFMVFLLSGCCISNKSNIHFSWVSFLELYVICLCILTEDVLRNFVSTSFLSYSRILTKLECKLLLPISVRGQCMCLKEEQVGNIC